MRTRREFTGLLAAAGIGTASSARAQEAWPSRTVRVVVPFGPGGTTDILARFLQPKLQELLGQSVVVENRPGAAGNIAMEQVVRSPADGYIVFMGDVGTISINHAIYPNMSFDPAKDLAAVSIVADTSSLLVANPAFPPNSVPELVEYVKARPGAVSFASQGSGSLNRLAMEVLAEKAGLRMIHIPYRGGSGPAAIDIIAGNVPMMFATIASVIGHVRGGRLKALGVTTAERHPALPDLPTLKEAGYPDLVVSSWQGIFVPSATPAPVVAKLHDCVNQALTDATIRSRIADGGSIPVGSPTPAAATIFAAGETTRWGGLARAMGATAD